MEMKYSAAVSDMLVRIYNYMVNHNLEMTASGAYLADRTISIGTASQKFYDKFITELDYIKELSAKQPITTLTYKYLDMELNEVGELQTETFKSYQLLKVLEFIERKKRELKYNANIKSVSVNDAEGVFLCGEDMKLYQKIFGE